MRKWGMNAQSCSAAAQELLTSTAILPTWLRVKACRVTDGVPPAVGANDVLVALAVAPQPQLQTLVGCSMPAGGSGVERGRPWHSTAGGKNGEEGPGRAGHKQRVLQCQLLFRTQRCL